jgi:hypothetical protein
VIIKPATAMMRHYPWRSPLATVDPEEATMTEVQEEMLIASNALYNQMATTAADKKRFNGKPLLFPVAADATTFEALTGALAKSGRPHFYEAIDPQTGEVKKKAMPITCSLCFCLEEISSLFRRHTEDVAKFLLNTYDCGDYTYDTKTQGTDVIKRCCVSILGGTTPAFMKQVFTDQLLTDGFASRAFFIYETENRFNKLYIADVCNEQLEARVRILEHIKRLSQLYGQVRLTPEADEFMKEWWEVKRGERTNNNPKLDSYYARKNLHVMKMAMILHFADNVSMDVTVEECHRAIDLLEKAERRMHLALTFTSKNPLTSLCKHATRFIEANPGVTKDDLIVELFEDAENPMEDIPTVLDYLLNIAKKIQMVSLKKGTGYKIRE